MATETGPRGARYGWVFGAVWLVYLSENLTALLARPDDWRRDLGLVALAGLPDLVCGPDRDRLGVSAA